MVGNILPNEIPKIYNKVNNIVRFFLAQNSNINPFPTLKEFWANPSKKFIIINTTIFLLYI